MVSGGEVFWAWVVRKLRERGVPEKNIFTPRSSEFDLRKWENREEVIGGREVVVHIAALSGNAEFHRKNPGLVFYNNLMIGAQLMEASRLSGVQKFVSKGRRSL